MLEILDRDKMAPLDERDALAQLKAKWLEQLQPFGDRGYTPTPKEA